MCSKCSASASVLSRREFIKIGGAGVAGAALLGIMGSGSALAQTGSSLVEEFEAAARASGVPLALLLAVGYANSRWEMPPPEAGDYEPGDIHGMGGYGVMRLRDAPGSDTLGRAAELTNIPEEELKADRAKNILGGAAVISALRGEEKPADLNGWYDAVSGFGDGALYANQVFDALQDGATAETSSGEEVVLEPQEDAEPQTLYNLAASADYSGATWYGAYSGNYSNANRPASNPINKVIIHVVQGSYSSAINWFKDPRAGVSAHYTVSTRGEIGQSVRDEDIGYHAGYWPYNQTSIGIEHEGYVTNSSYFTDAMYRSSARLTAHLCKKYKIPIDRNHIVGHYEVPGCSGPGGGGACHTDPGYLSGGRIAMHWNWTRYMRLVKEFAGGAPEKDPDAYRQVVDNTSGGRFKASSRWVVSDWSPQRYGANYRVLKKPLSKMENAAFKVKTPKKGPYAVYARWPADPGYNDKTRFRIKTAGGWVRRTVDQRQSGGRWVSLGVHTLEAGDGFKIQVSSKSSGKGYIIADAVMIVER
jgi:hypothetical protein